MILREWRQVLLRRSFWVIGFIFLAFMTFLGYFIREPFIGEVKGALSGNGSAWKLLDEARKACEYLPNISICRPSDPGRFSDLIAFVSLAVNCLLLYFATTAVRQLKLSQHEVGANVYRKFIEPSMRRVRQYTRSEILTGILIECGGIFEEVRADLQSHFITENSGPRWEKFCLDVEEKIKGIEARMEEGRISFGKKEAVSDRSFGMSVPEFLNEYVFMADLVVEGIIRKNFGTKLNHDNNLRIFRVFWPYIKLRMLLQKNYAFEFCEFYLMHAPKQGRGLNEEIEIFRKSGLVGSLSKDDRLLGQ